MSEITQESIPLMNYLKVFFRRKELIIIPIFLGLIFGICVGVLMPKEYMSSTVIMIEEGKSDNPLFDKLAVSTTVHQRLAVIREAMLGWTSLVELIKRLHLDANIEDRRQYEGLVNSLRKNIRISAKTNNVIDLSYVDRDPQVTKDVIETITNIFIERNQEIMDQETQDAIAFITEQLKVYKGKIKSAEIAKMQDQLNELLIDSTEKHPLVLQLRERINAKKEELRKENLEFTEGNRLQFESDTTIIASIKEALQKIDSSLTVKNDKGGDVMSKVMLIDKLDNVMARDALVNEGLYNMLLQRLETAKITQRLQASKEGTKYTIIDPPRVPLDPVKPNRLLIALAGMVFGGIVGFGMVVASEFLDKSFIDVEDAKEFLGIPLLGAISKINTEDSLRQEKDKKRWMYSLTLVAGVAMIIVTISFASFFK